MDFRIADTFTDSLSRLTGDEQRAAKTTAFDLQLNPANPGSSFHRLDKANDKNFWSVRVNSDMRLIVHRIPESLRPCYVDHHDKAYDWVDRRKLETHPKTGAAQLVEVREKVQEIVVLKYVEAPRAAIPLQALFSKVPVPRARAAVEQAGIPFKLLDEHVETTRGYASISTMHLAKGLEFRAVAAMACDDEIIPLQERIETVGDDADLQEVYDTDRHLLYVACTRAPDFCW